MTVMEITVTPESISVLGRHRLRSGRLTTLGDHIAANGLHDPLILTPDHRILGGERCALAMIAHGNGQQRVPAYVVDDLPEAVKLLMARGSTLVKPMNVEEKVLLGYELEALDEEANAQRRKLIGSAGGQSRNGYRVTLADRGTDKWPGTSTYIAELFEVARSTYQRMRWTWMATKDNNAPEELRQIARTALDEMNTHRASIYGAYQEVRAARIEAGLTLHISRRDIAVPGPRVLELQRPSVTELVAVLPDVLAPVQPAPAAEPPAPVGEAPTEGPKQRRRPLPDQIDRQTTMLVNTLSALEKLQADDRWSTYRKKLAPSTRNELLNAVARIAAIAENLPDEDSREDRT